MALVKSIKVVNCTKYCQHSSNCHTPTSADNGMWQIKSHFSMLQNAKPLDEEALSHRIYAQFVGLDLRQHNSRRSKVMLPFYGPARRVFSK